MAECDVCGKEQNMPYECNRCGGTFCVEHRLPESHDCAGLNAWSGSEGDGTLGGASPGTASHRQSGGTIGGDSGGGLGGGLGGSGGLLSKLPIDTHGSGLLGYFRGNVTFLFLLLMWLTFAVQLLLGGLGVPPLEYSLFYFKTWAFLDVWTWVTSIFAHGGFAHIAMNSIALYFFGPLVERKLGSKRFAILFLLSGVLSGVGAVGFSLLLSDPMAAVGASGAILAVLGVLTILNPDLRVMLLFPPIPMPLWVLTAGYAVFSAFFVGIGAPGAFGIGHAAHLFGLLIGLAYGYRLKEQGMRGPQQLQMGGGPGGPGGPGGGLGGGRGRF